VNRISSTHVKQLVGIQRRLSANRRVGVTRREAQLQEPQVGGKDVGNELHAARDPAYHLHVA